MALKARAGAGPKMAAGVAEAAGHLQAGEFDLPLLASEVFMCSGGQVGTRATVLCCMCGAATQWNASSMCNNCLKTRVDISEGIPRECIIQRCRGCGRYLDPPNHWVLCDRETKELLAVCLKRIKGLSKVKLIDASFIWTEPHSRRIKIKLTIQKEAFTDVVLQQVLAVELKVENYHCVNCHKVATKVSWEAVVQVRQRVDHKRTFYLVEQLILKHKAHAQISQIKEVPDGIDFFFIEKRHSQALINFITSVVPCRVKTGGERVISEDFKNNSAKRRVATCLEIVPLCKDDLVMLNRQLYTALGNVGPLVLVTNVGAALRVIDVHRGLVADLRAEVYFRNTCEAVGSMRNAITYTVIDVECTGAKVDKYAFAEVTVARSCDLGANDVSFVCTSHLGNILHAGDEVLGYDVSRMQSASQAQEAFKNWPKGVVMPDVVLIKKVAPQRSSGTRRRIWKLRSLIKEEEDGQYVSRHRGGQGEAVKDDYEEFLADIEADPHVRADVALYKDPSMWRINPDGSVVLGRGLAAAAVQGGGGSAGGEELEEWGTGGDGGEEADGITAEVLLDSLVLGEDEEELVGYGLLGSPEEAAPQALTNGPA